MKYSSKRLGIILLAVGVVNLVLDGEKTVAIGCDTYYRITGAIAGCSDISTEDARELWLEKYNICLQRQLSTEISIYKSKAKIYYAELDRNPEQNINFENIVLSDEDIATVSLAQSSATYQEADFCD